MKAMTPPISGSKRSLKAFLKTLDDAYVVCFDCGTTWGVYSVGCSSVWEGKCDVCKQEKRITEARDFAYLITGRRAIISHLKTL